MKKYRATFNFSYALGVFPVIELLEQRPSEVIKIVLHSKGLQNSGVVKICSLCDLHKIPVEYNDKLINLIALKENCYALGMFSKYENKIQESANHVVLVNPADMGNLGTIIRTLVGFEILNLGLIKPSVDIFDPKVIRSSMGSLFKMRFSYFDNFPSYEKAYSNHLYFFMTNGDIQLEKAFFESPYTLVFGSESSGLPKEFKTFGNTIKINQSEHIDSLALPVAVGVSTYFAKSRTKTR